MNGIGVAEPELSVEAWLEHFSSAGHLGWIIHDGFLDSVALWIEHLANHERIHLLGRLNPAGSSVEPWRDVKPLLAELDLAINPWPEDPQAALDLVLATLRMACQGHERMPVLLIQQPAALDEHTQRALGILAREGTVQLAFHLVPGARLPERFQRLADAGYLRPSRSSTISVAELAALVTEHTGRSLPTLQAIAWHRAIAGEEQIARELMPALADPATRERVMAGRLEMLPHVSSITGLLRLRRSQLTPAMRQLMDLCALAGHLPVASARQLASRKAVDDCLSAGLLRTVRCGVQQALEFSASLLAGYWFELLGAYELLGLGERLEAAAVPCAHPAPNMVLAALQRGEEIPSRLLVAAVLQACEHGGCQQAGRLAAALRQRLSSERDPGDHQLALVALARYAAVASGPYQALRLLNLETGTYRCDWADAGVRQLVIQLYMETGRLFPTIQRLAGAGGYRVPADRQDPACWELLPADPVHRHLRLGLEYSTAQDLRRAAIHFTAGLRRCISHPGGPNAATLRVTLLENVALALSMGGYRRQFELLEQHLRDHPEHWHRRAAPAWHLAAGVLQLQGGLLETGRISVSEAAELSGRQDQSHIEGSAHGLATWLDAQVLERDAAEDKSLLPLMERVPARRIELEELASRALMRAPQLLRAVIEQSRDQRDPRGLALNLSARADLGEVDPLPAIRRLMAMKQGFLAAWVADGLLLRRMLPYWAGTPLPTSRANDQLEVFARELIARCDDVQLPQLDPDLVALIRDAPPQSLSALPFVAAEARQRSLTRREAQVLELVRRGYSNRGIAGELTLSVRTVEGHIASILAKYALTGRSQLLDQPAPVPDGGEATT